MPNDVHIVGGAQRPGASGELGDDQKEGAPNVVICTGANACGKVRKLPYLFFDWLFEILGFLERVPEAG